MKWTIIEKDKSSYPPSVNKYTEYKPYLRTEADRKCVYCGINEALFGGVDSFHVEHFKPKSIERFKEFEKDYFNLFYACSVCNRFKSNDWYDNYSDDHSSVGYPDPNRYNYNDLFITDTNFVLEGKYTSSRYLVEKLYLNRPQLILARQLIHILELYSELKGEVDSVLSGLMKATDTVEALKMSTLIGLQLNKIMSSFTAEIEKSKYEISDIRRSN